MRTGTATARAQRQAFIAAVRKGLTTAGAAAAAGIHRSLVYKWQKKYPEFDAAWAEAEASAAELLEDEVLRRAMEGVEKPVFYRGQQVGTTQVYSDRLLLTMLQRRRPLVDGVPQRNWEIALDEAEAIALELRKEVAAARDRIAQLSAELETARRALTGLTSRPSPSPSPDEGAHQEGTHLPESPGESPLPFTGEEGAHRASDAKVRGQGPGAACEALTLPSRSSARWAPPSPAGRESDVIPLPAGEAAPSSSLADDSPAAAGDERCASQSGRAGTPQPPRRPDMRPDVDQVPISRQPLLRDLTPAEVMEGLQYGPAGSSFPPPWGKGPLIRVCDSRHE